MLTWEGTPILGVTNIVEKLTVCAPAALRLRYPD